MPHLSQTGFTMIFKTTKQKKAKPQYRGSSLFPVLSADKLLASDKKQIVLEKIQTKIDFPSHYYQLLYGNLLHDFAEFVQLIPARTYGKLGQLLNDGLHRGLLALQICAEEDKSPLFTYAVFTVALLENIGIVPTQQIVILSNKRGEFIKEWQPVFGSMALFGDYYKLRFTGRRWINLKHYLTPILAQQLLPELGLQWLLTDKHLYELWLAILYGDDKTGWAIKIILQLIDERLDDLRKELDFEDVDVPITEPKETEAGEKFLEWLIDGLDDGTIKVNEKDAFVHIVDEGVLLEYPGIFRLFTEIYPGARDWTVPVLQSHYNALGLAKLSGYDYRFEQFFSKYPGKVEDLIGGISSRFLGGKEAVKAAIKKGNIIASKELLFPKKEIPANDINLKSSKTKTSLRQLKNLDKSIVQAKKSPKYRRRTG